MNDECWTGDHRFYILTLALPSLILWGICLPLFALYRMSAADRRLPHAKAVYGFLYQGYVPRKFWWELMIILRKFLILLSLVFLNRVSVLIQALVSLFILIIALRLQILVNPYIKYKHNRLEDLSLICGAFMIYAGTLYLSGDIGEETKIALFIVILLVTTIFYITWIRAYIHEAIWAYKF